MKIIKTGKLPGSKKYTTTCSNCKTEFEFTQDEGTITNDQRDGDYISINCPLRGCGKVVNVSTRLGG